MPDYRLVNEDGHVVASATHDDDRAAVLWRASAPVSGPAEEPGRGVRLEKQSGDEWVELPATGRADAY